ncbi:glutathione S-transferase [Bdellovibrio bacteriovorus]|uniref:Glutathione S-transferase n=1 Tax=Bdellovibrio bacteriovorus TaxID=959 RepID=A0A150WJI8_BDEBC|nr:glutathione S-transferase family protein [Bdellovibrio bacteriovorus]KYG63882.1 glutathione S-transferase [Bdellovibrio bacteriovorus]
MIDLYTAATPNGQKAHLMLEELGIPYKLHKVNLKDLEQKKPEFLAMNPNGRIPVMVDHEGPNKKEVTVFESAAILYYLAERHHKFGGHHLEEKAQIMQWMMYQMSAVGPMFGNYYFGKTSLKPENPGFIERFEKESKRIITVLETQLGRHTYFAGSEYTIADMCMFFWINNFFKANPDWFAATPGIRRWIGQVAERPAVQKVLQA